MSATESLFNLKIEDISSFFEKNTKTNNDCINKLRESIIENILNDTIPKKWYSDNLQWFNVAFHLKEFVKKINKSELKEVTIKAGRNFNYDFLFEFKNGEIEKIEFKNGVTDITKYPEILSVSSNSFIKGISYPDYFYDIYLTAITNDEPPTKEFYLKNIHKNKVNCDFFINLKKENNFKITVDESIDDYLQNYLNFDFDAFKLKIKDQIDKKFMLWKDGVFYLDFLTEGDIDIIPEIILKGGKNGFNTIILNTKNNSCYHLLLRWKNGLGILYPAWQVKFKRNEKI